MVYGRNNYKRKAYGLAHAMPQYSRKRARTGRLTTRRGFLTRGSAVSRARVQEKKFFDLASANYALNTTGSITHIDVVPQGNTVQSRIGRKYRLTGLQIRGNAQSEATTTVTTGAMYIIWDRRPCGALAAITDFLETAHGVSFTNRDNSSRFKILKKMRWSFAGESDTTTGANPGRMYDVDEYIDLKRHGLVAEATTTDTTGAIGTRESGAILAVTVGITAAGTAAANITCTYRTSFTEV